MSNRRKPLLPIALIVLSLLTMSTVTSAEPITLALKPTAGETQKLRATVEQKVSQTVNGNAQTMTQTIGLGYSFATLSVADDGVATVKVTYDTVAFKQQSPLGNVDYDSEKPAAQVPPMAKGFAALAGQTFTMKVTPIGKITEISGLEPMIDSILKKLDIPEGPSKPLVEKSIRKEFGEDALKDNMESMLAVYPDKPVSPGESWMRKVSIAKGIPMVMDNTFTLKDATPDLATLDVKSKLTTNADAPPIDIGNRKLTYQLSGEQTGTLKLDRKNGWLKSEELNQKVSGEMVADAGGGQIMKTPMTIEMKVTMEAK